MKKNHKQPSKKTADLMKKLATEQLADASGGLLRIDICWTCGLLGTGGPQI